MEILVYLVFLILIILSLLGKRWAYVATIILGILFFLFRVHFQLAPTACQLAFDIPLAIYSLTNYKHIFLFSVFFIMTRRQIKKDGYKAFIIAALATLAFGLIVEFLEGATDDGHCRMRDLVPDFAGVLVGEMIFFLWSNLSVKFHSKHKSKS